MVSSPASSAAFSPDVKFPYEFRISGAMQIIPDADPPTRVNNLADFARHQGIIIGT